MVLTKKVKYWTRLRKQLNIILLLIYGIILLVNLIFQSSNIGYVLFYKLGSTTSPLLIAIYCLIYLALSNTLLLCIEMVDRYVRFSSGALSSAFRYIALVVLGLLPLVLFYAATL